MLDELSLMIKESVYSAVACVPSALREMRRLKKDAKFTLNICFTIHCNLLLEHFIS